MKAKLLLSHRWTGLAIVGFLLLAGLTGSVLTFYNELDRTLNPDFYEVVPGSQRKPLLEILEAVARTYPHIEIKRVSIPRLPADSVQMEVELRANKGSSPATQLRFDELWVDPYSGNIVGRRDSSSFGVDRASLMPSIYMLHKTLLAGDVGKWLLGVVALLWFLDHFAGALLAIPRRGGLREIFRIRWQGGVSRLLFDLHKSISVGFWIVLATVAFTGMYFNLDKLLKPTVNALSPITTPYEKTIADRMSATNPPVPVEHAIETARAHLPGSVPTTIRYWPDKSLYRVELKQAGDLREFRGDTSVYVDMRDGRILNVRTHARGSAGDVFTGWQYPLHSGQALGIAGRILICISGLALILAAGTGLALWLKRTRARRFDAMRAFARL